MEKWRVEKGGGIGGKGMRGSKGKIASEGEKKRKGLSRK